MKKLISVICPVYKVEDYIARCVKSALHQTYKNLEIILVDDCGADNSIEIATKVLSESDVNYRIEYHEKNSGLSAARNTGLKVAHGEYVYFLDSDDWIASDTIEEMYDAAMKYDAECVVAGYDDCEDVSGMVIASPYVYRQEQFFANRQAVVDAYCGKSIPVTAWNKLIKRDFLLKNNLFFTEGIYHEDSLWTFQLFARLKNCVLIPKQTYKYSINPNSIMNFIDEAKMQKRVESSLVVLKRSREWIEDETDAVIKNRLNLKIEDTKVYMYRKLLADGVSNDTFSTFYNETHSCMSLSNFMLLSIKDKVLHIDQLMPSCLGLVFFRVVYKFLLK